MGNGIVSVAHAPWVVQHYPFPMPHGLYNAILSPWGMGVMISPFYPLLFPLFNASSPLICPMLNDSKSNTWNVLLVKIPQKTRGIIREHVPADLHTKIPPTWPSVAPGRLVDIQATDNKGFLLPDLVRVHVRQVIVIWKLHIRVWFTIGNELGVRVILQSRPLTTTTPRSTHELRTRSVPTDDSYVLVEFVAPDLNDLIVNRNQPVLMTVNYPVSLSRGNT
ncbi:hypothetical protein BJ322DRAFT_1017702 [Thelephora terrestris]|uniref:Uncharacterized protein n=1 Tax=Thelephora terrestris TaxID=56493 RepID=A0A9P6HPV0_9AGAM|nr:hypothetical protein BJ322DRAFT_1017702 [Thelephora terrestris]